MAVTRTLSNRFKLELGKQAIDFDGGDFRVILMSDAFTFDRDAHGLYSDVSASELSTGNGYTQIDKVLVTGDAWAQDNAANKAAITWENLTWTADGGSIGPTGAAIILQHDSGTPANSIIVGCIDFGEEITVTDGVSFQLQNLGFDLTQAV